MFLDLSLGSVYHNSDIDHTIQLRSISTICTFDSEYIQIADANQLINAANMFYNIRNIFANLDELISDFSHKIIFSWTLLA